MKQLFILFTISLAILQVSCQFENTDLDDAPPVDEGQIEGNIYKSHEIGWTFTIPEGWEITSMKETMELNERGKKAMEEVIEDEVSFSEYRNLLAFQKDEYNNFQSSSESFIEEYEGHWKENNEQLKELLFQTYEKQGIIVQGSETETVDLDGLEFELYTMTLFTAEGNLILEQMMISRIINGFDFNINLNYNNSDDRDLMLKAVVDSKFKIRD